MNNIIFIHTKGFILKDKKTHIHDCAKKIFSEKGFKDTGISDIAQKAGMAVGTFYNYYPSKEKLFMDIFSEENAKLKRKCYESLDLKQSPITVVKQMLRLNAQGIDADPILREWYNKNVFDKIQKIYREEKGIDATEFLYDSFLKIVEQWQSEGKMRRDIDSRMIMMIFAAIINIDTHKEEIGIAYFPQLLECMTELVMNGLTDGC